MGNPNPETLNHGDTQELLLAKEDDAAYWWPVGNEGTFEGGLGSWFSVQGLGLGF